MAVIALACILVTWLANLGPSSARAEIVLTPGPMSQSIHVRADHGQHWKQGTYEAWVLEGNCRLTQGDNSVSASEAVVWIKRGDELGDRKSTVLAYFEGAVTIDATGGRNKLPAATAAASQVASWYGEFGTTTDVEVKAPGAQNEPAVKPPVFERALEHRQPDAPGAIERAQFSSFDTPPAVATEIPPGTRRLQALPRSGVPFQVQAFRNPQNSEIVAVVSQGVNLIIDGLPLPRGENSRLGTVDVSCDNLVIWTRDPLNNNLQDGTLQRSDAPLELYMEGNIIFREGDRVIYADRMYYDVRNEVGTVLQAEMLTPAPEYSGQIRIRADVVRQTGHDHFFAQNTFITNSRIGEPTYRLQTGDVYFEDNLRSQYNPFTGVPVVDPATGEPIVTHDRLATSNNNFLFLGEVPVFYWPTLATDLEQPTFYLRRAQFKNDKIFGTQILTQFDAYQILGIRDKPKGTDWIFDVNYLSDRGLALGTTFRYDRPDFFGLMPGSTNGLLDVYGLDDGGLDTLGSDRMKLQPEADFRYRILARHRQYLPDGYTLTAEIGRTSDRNFIEQYFEREWDEDKDQNTGIELKQTINNSSWFVTADARLNPYFMETEGVQVGHYLLGQPVAWDWLTFFEHSKLGYLHLAPADPPTNPVELAKFTTLPGEADRQGSRVSTRNEIDLPFSAGPVKVVPYALGELAHWGEDIDGDSLDRAYGAIGVRASIPFWTANPDIESGLFNVHGIAHKITFESDLFMADATQDLSELPLYDPLDDDAQEQFRRRFTFNTFGGTLPPAFDDRSYALRSGMGSWVTSPTTEVADDLAALRLGVNQRWQTKRGLPGQRRIIDWIVLDTHATIFPNPDRDNFGEVLGLIDTDFRWHIGDRLTLLSDAEMDLFPDGKKSFTVAVSLNRPPRGDIYLGYRTLRGPIDSEVLAFAYSYRLSPKWVSTVAGSVDIGGNGNIGQRVLLTRIGESFLVSLGFNVDASKNNAGVSFLVEPRFIPHTKLGHAGGAEIPPAGIFGLE